MKDTLKIDCLMQAMGEYIAAKTEEAAAREAYQGYSWGYAGSRYIDKVAEKAARVEDALSKVIREHVRKEVAAMLSEVGR